MNTFPIEDHSVQLSQDYSTLNVECGGNQVASFSLQKVDPVWVRITGEDFEIGHQNKGQMNPYFTESINLEDFSEEGFKINADGGIGIVVIRDTFKTYHYHLDECAILLELKDSEVFQIHSPCTTPCAAPDSICRTISFAD